MHAEFRSGVRIEKFYREQQVRARTVRKEDYSQSQDRGGPTVEAATRRT